MNHVHDSMEETPLEVAWQNFLREAGLATAVTASKYFDEAVKARLATELPSITKAVLNHPLDKLGDPIECETFAAAKAPQPEADGDVPEWLTDYEGKSIDGFDTQAIWDAVNAEISRRVADVAADRDKWIERAGEHAAAVVDQAKQLAAAQAEVARLTRPVEGVDWAMISTTSIGPASQPEWYRTVTEPLLLAERNAREAAERERDELRAACNKYALHTGRSKRGDSEFFYIIDGRGDEHASLADAVLAAYRTEKKGKVQA